MPTPRALRGPTGLLVGAVLLHACSAPRAAPERLAALPGGSPAWSWCEVVAWEPGPQVSDRRHRRRVVASSLPWRVRDRVTGVEMVLILPGEFLMGSPEQEAGRGDDEGPQHRVRLTRPYYLGATEVSQAQWRAVMGPFPSFFEGDELPIDPSWNDAQAFLGRANEGLTSGLPSLRLPTEAEWEFACRAGTSGPFSFEGPIGHGLVNFCDGWPESALVVDGRLEVIWTIPPDPECRVRTAACGSLPPNPWGLHEMHGNLWEWCVDRYRADAYRRRSGQSADPVVDESEEPLHVLRGGSWYDPATECRAAVRDRGGPQVRSNRIGLRVARTVPAGRRPPQAGRAGR